MDDDGADLKPRTLMRRRQVMEAAGRCFRLHGFHVCSMAQISAEAGMSVGHIYRYFTNKDAIIEAIVQQDMDDVVEQMCAFPFDAADLKAELLERMTSAVARALDPDKAALMIEIRAEAVHNPVVAAAVRRGDETINGLARQIIRAAVGRPLDEADIDARVELIHLVFNGMTLRTVVMPRPDPTVVAAMVRLIVERILE